MGDVQIIVSIATQLLSETETKNVTTSSHSIRCTLASDATVCELWTDHLMPLLSHGYHGVFGSNQHHTGDGASSIMMSSVVACYDTTRHPPKDVTSAFVEFGRERSGPASRTLYDMDWFPSGRLTIAPFGSITPESLLRQHEYDSQYNVPDPSSRVCTSATTNNNSTVQLIQGMGTGAGEARPAPTQVFQSVASRFDNDPIDDENGSHMGLSRMVAKAEQQRRVMEAQQRREHRLDAFLNKLSSQTSKVSQQVRTMLIKRRAVGPKQLRMEDRIHFQVIVWNDTTLHSELPGQSNHNVDNDAATAPQYMFGSKAATIGRLVDQISSLLSLRQSSDAVLEFIVNAPNSSNRTTDNTGSRNIAARYARIPNTMTLMEAIRAEYISDFDAIIIRSYNSTTKDNSIHKEEINFAATEGVPTPSILDMKMDPLERKYELVCSKDDEMEDVAHEITSKISTDELPKATQKDLSEDTALSSSVGIDWSPLIESTLLEMEQEMLSSKKKKPSTTSAKVRSMLMKGKAMGDKKRVKAVEDRFYLELVILSSESNTNVLQVICPSLYLFVSNKDPIMRIVDTCNQHGKQKSPTLLQEECQLFSLVSISDRPRYRLLNHSMTLSDAQVKGIVTVYDRVILLHLKNKKV